MSGNPVRKRGTSAKSKRQGALFDLLSKDNVDVAERLKVPGWWPGGRKPTGLQPDESAGEHPADAPPAERATGPVQAADSAGATSADTPLIQLDGDRVRISLTSVTTAVLVFVVMIALLAAFEIGRKRGDSTGFARGYEAGRASYAADAMSEIEAARNQPPATYLVESILSEPDVPVAAGQIAGGTDDGAVDAAPVQWVRDYTYIVAQEFGRDSADDAQRAQAFLASHGIDTALIRRDSGAIQLITTQGYNRKDPTQKRLADQFLEKEQAIGTQYYAAGGRYRLQGYFKTLKDDTW